MGKRRKKTNPVEELLNILFGLTIITSVYIYTKTNSITTAIAFFITVIALIIVLGIIKKAKRRKFYLSSGIDVVDKMSGEEFERFLLAHFKNLGYKGDTTPKTNDYGADLILNKDNVKMVLQAKRWTSKVGIEAIQQIVAAINYYGAHKGIVITNNYFTKNAFELAQRNHIELWDRNKLIEIMSKSQGREIALNKLDAPGSCESVIDKCPRCGGDLIKRKGSKGEFLGCSSYPRCRHTENV